MTRAELAERLVACEGDEARRRLLEAHPALTDVSLAHALKDICLDGWRSHPARANGAAASLRALSELDDSPEIAAHARWGEGISALVAGQMGEAVTRLDDAAARFNELCQPATAAATQVSKLIALAMLGRYDEAIETGLRAREVFLAHGDLPAAGRIEHNVGNICWRRDRYREAEEYLRAARERFAAVGDFKQLAMVENSLAFNYTLQNDFRSAEQLYKQAFERAERAGLVVTQAEIELSMGDLALFQGRYDRALDLLERARRRYAALDMPHQSAVVELELADAYLELNLATEAAAIYERVARTFAGLGMRAELARAQSQAGRAALVLGDTERAHRLLAEARTLYAAEGNDVGEAVVTLAEAQLHHAEGEHEAAGRLAAQAETPLARAGVWRRTLLARWLRGEAARAAGHERLSKILLEDTLSDSEAQALPQIAERCHTSLGLLAASSGDTRAAEESFKRAVSLVESLRAPLPAEEFRTAFVSDKLVPYDELVRLCLADRRADRAGEALCYVERARSRALVEMLSGALDFRARARDAFEAELVARLEELREELNWFYSQINRPVAAAEGVRRSGAAMEALHQAVREREAKTLEIMRQLRQRGDGAAVAAALPQVEALDLAALRRALGDETALVEYTALDGELLAFVLTGEGVEVVRGLGSEAEAAEALAGFRFQIGALRYGAPRLRSHLPDLALRTRRHLSTLYDLLLRRVEERIGGRRLVVVPHRALHYVPFHALFDGDSYVVERREVCYAPSATVLRHCLAAPRKGFERAVLLGVADEQTPRVRDEIEALAPLFPEALALLDERATLAALAEHAPRADVLHLACHGQFRPDSPLFSSLRLADGWLTVRDAYALELRAGLVTLSACETGVSAVAPGEELIGLARGFFSTGAPTLLVTLWTVDDEATASLMASFYTRLRAGSSPAEALRRAQLELLGERPHPFFWSPFVLLGRW